MLGTPEGERRASAVEHLDIVRFPLFLFSFTRFLPYISSLPSAPFASLNSSRPLPCPSTSSRRAATSTSSRLSVKTSATIFLPSTHPLLRCRTSSANHLLVHRIQNPLHGIPRAQLIADVEAFASRNGLDDHADAFRKGALVAQSPGDFEDLTELTEDEKVWLRMESTSESAQRPLRRCSTTADAFDLQTGGSSHGQCISL